MGSSLVLVGSMGQRVLLDSLIPFSWFGCPLYLALFSGCLALYCSQGNYCQIWGFHYLLSLTSQKKVPLFKRTLEEYVWITWSSVNPSRWSDLKFYNCAVLGHVRLPRAGCCGATPTWSEWDYQRLTQPKLLCFICWNSLDFVWKKDSMS